MSCDTEKSAARRRLSQRRVRGLCPSGAGLLAAVLVLGLWAPAARAADAILQAFAYEPIPPGATVQVRPLDDSNENLEIKRQFEASLAARNHPVSPAGALIFDFEAVRVLHGRRDDPKSLGRFRATSGSAQATFNIYSNTDHSVLGGTYYSDDFRTANGYTLYVNVRDRASGTLLWQGEASGELHGNDPLPIADDMVAALVANLGLTARSQPIAVD